MAEERSTPADEARRLYEEAETRTARAMEQLVARESFGELLARMTENVLAVAKLGNDAADLVVRNLRLAGRRDITGLARQLARTEDKLELVLQEVERLQAQVGERGSENGAQPARAPAANRRSRSSSRSTKS
jgi:hypothetical protein